MTAQCPLCHSHVDNQRIPIVSPKTIACSTIHFCTECGSTIESVHIVVVGLVPVYTCPMCDAVIEDEKRRVTRSDSSKTHYCQICDRIIPGVDLPSIAGVPTCPHHNLTVPTLII